MLFSLVNWMRIISVQYPGTPPDSIWLAMITSFDQTSKCHFLSPNTPHITEPLWMPMRILRSTYICSEAFCTIIFYIKMLVFFFNIYVNVMTNIFDGLNHMKASFNAAHSMVWSRFPRFRIEHWNTVIAITQQFNTQTMIVLWTGTNSQYGFDMRI